jgi:hypothetical protein
VCDLCGIANNLLDGVERGRIHCQMSTGVGLLKFAPSARAHNAESKNVNKRLFSVGRYAVPLSAVVPSGNIDRRLSLRPRSYKCQTVPYSPTLPLKSIHTKCALILGISGNQLRPEHLIFPMR